LKKLKKSQKNFGYWRFGVLPIQATDFYGFFSVFMA